MTGKLSPRERQIIGMLSHGVPQKDVADKIGTTVYTLRAHMRMIYAKTGAKNVTQAAVMFARGQI